MAQVVILRAPQSIVEQIQELIDGAEKPAKVGCHLVVGFKCDEDLAGFIAVFDCSEHGSNPLKGLGRVALQSPGGVGRVRGADRLSVDPLGYSKGKCT